MLVQMGTRDGRVLFVDDAIARLREAMGSLRFSTRSQLRAARPASWRQCISGRDLGGRASILWLKLSRPRKMLRYALLLSGAAALVAPALPKVSTKLHSTDYAKTLYGVGPETSYWDPLGLADLGTEAPAGFAFLGHSLRSGGSSAAEAIAVPRYRGTWLGGWSQSGRTRELHYLDPSVLPTDAAHALFGWLRAGAYACEQPSWVARRGAVATEEPGEP